jgi:hypothetical protein
MLSACFNSISGGYGKTNNLILSLPATHERVEDLRIYFLFRAKAMIVNKFVLQQNDSTRFALAPCRAFGVT